MSVNTNGDEDSAVDGGQSGNYERNRVFLPNVGIEYHPQILQVINHT